MKLIESTGHLDDNHGRILLRTISCRVLPTCLSLKTLQIYSGEEICRKEETNYDIFLIYFSDTKIQADTARRSLSQSMGKVNMIDMDKEEEEDIYQSTKF